MNGILCWGVGFHLRIMEIDLENMVSEKIEYIDISRAICMIWIVGFWHMQEYINVNIRFLSVFTDGSLFCFAFISGLFLGKKRINSIVDALEFYKRRLLRLYPLFFLSATSFYIFKILFNASFICSFKQYILTVSGLACIFTPAPLTIWFIDAIIIMYLITPLINHLDKKNKKFILYFSIWLPLLLLHLFFHIVDERFLTISILYFVGLIFGSYNISSSGFSQKLKTILELLVILVFLFLNHRFNVDNDFIHFLVSVVVCSFILDISKNIAKIKAANKLLKYVSYSSMTCYLFHRQMLGIISKLLGSIHIAIAYLIVFPIIIIISYYIQYGYDKLLEEMKSKRSNIVKENIQ